MEKVTAALLLLLLSDWKRRMTVLGGKEGTVKEDFGCWVSWVSQILRLGAKGSGPFFFFCLVKAGIPTFGPSAEAAALEDPSAAKQYIQDQGAPIIIKADGLAVGKGVIVAMTLDEAYEAVDSMLVKNVFGSAGCHVIVEEFLEGEEASFFVLVDGENAVPLESAQDHKRVGDDGSLEGCILSWWVS